MTDVLAQMRFTTPGGAMVNTFAFHATTYADYAAHSTAVAAALTTFYTAGSTTDSLGCLMASWVSRSCELRTYDFNQGKPRVPTIYSITLPNAHTPVTLNKLPADVAMCLSWHGAPPITRSKRGRIFLGGAQTEWVVEGSAGALPTWLMISGGPAFRALTSMTTLAASPVGWCVRSQKYGGTVPVVGGYVDSEPDTQRRRGSPTSTRITWGS